MANAGVSGETAEDGLARFDWSVPPDTDALIVELGANDMLRGPGGRGRQARARRHSRQGEPGAYPDAAGRHEGGAPNLGPDYRADFDRIYPELAAQYGVALYPFFLDGVAADPKLNQPDGLHPNPEGVKVIVARILPAVEALLGPAKR